MKLREEVTARLETQALPPAKDCIVVSIDQQKLWHFRGADCQVYVVSTARAGRGCVQDSLRTPVGLHRICAKFGDDAAPGMVFKARRPTGQRATPADSVTENLITSRILWLDGLEPGLNRGRDSSDRVVDTKERFIYLHGTNQTARLGQPNSHGCVLLADDDIIGLYGQVPVGTIVLLRD